jgi:hypothetical protein
MSYFGNPEFNKENLTEMKEFRRIWKESSLIEPGIGKIEKINDVYILNKKSVDVKEPFIIISGWVLDHKATQLDSLYLIVDDEPFLKYTDFRSREDVIKLVNVDADIYSGYNISFLSGYLERGCHKIELVGMKNDTIMKFEEKLQICL